MTTLVVGASGATGKYLVEHLLNRGIEVKAFLRDGSELPDHIKDHENLAIIRGTVLDTSDMELASIVQDCDAVASCLGHNLSFKGLFLPPRKLVRDSIRKLYKAVQVHKSDPKKKFVLMGSSGVRNSDQKESSSLKSRIVVAILRVFLPPHTDNESAAEFFRVKIGQHDPQLEWVVVRPSGLIDNTQVSAYEATPSPVRDPIFDDGQISRINVGHFMAELIKDAELWSQWKGQMPVIYNSDSDA